jgi:hypothetical protein
VIALEPVAAIAPTPVAPAPAAPVAAAPVTKASVSAPSIATVPTADNQSRPSSWHTWGGISLVAAGAAAIGWGVYWIAIEGHSTGQNDSNNQPIRYATQTPGLIIAGAGAAAALGGAALIYFTGRHSADSTIAVGLTPGSLLLRGKF